MHQRDYSAGDMLTLPNLRRVRQLKLMSQRALAERAKVSPATVASIEAGKAAQFETVRKLCDALEVDVKELIGGG